MSQSVGVVEAFLGGVSALLGPEMLLAGFAVVCGAAVAGARERSRRADLVLALVMAAILASVWIRADLVPPARFSHWLALIPLLGLVEIRRQRAGHEDWMVPAIAVCTAGLVLFWRIDRYGPVLATVRGDWQEPLGYGLRSVYHLGTGLALAVVLFVLVQFFRRLRGRGPVGWGVLVVGALVVVLDLAAPLQRWLLLHGPPWRVG